MYCKEHKENACPDYAFGHCYGCNAFVPQPEVDMDALQKDAYEKFKMHWLMSHGITFQTIVSAFSEYLTDCCVEASENGMDLETYLNDSYFESWLEEKGFHGELWPCFEEWLENEWQGNAMDEGNDRRGCKTYPVKNCDAYYRGSRCAAMRAEAGNDFDPEDNEGVYVVEMTDSKKTLITIEAENAEAAITRACRSMSTTTPDEYRDGIKTETCEQVRAWKEN